MFAGNSGEAQSAHCLTRRDVTFFSRSTYCGDKPTRSRYISEGIIRKIGIRMEKSGLVHGMGLAARGRGIERTAALLL